MSHQSGEILCCDVPADVAVFQCGKSMSEIKARNDGASQVAKWREGNNGNSQSKWREVNGILAY